MILTNGNLNLRRLMAGTSSGKKITHIAVGTSGTAVAAGDTVLTGEIKKAVTATVELSEGRIQFQASLEAGDPSIVIQELGLYNQDGVLVHRKVISPYTRTTGTVTSLAYNLKVV